jgi:PBSX family phage terminase large subunit
MTEILPPFSKKQLEFIVNSNAKWNIAHGSVSTGKTICTTFAFLASLNDCPDSLFYISGHTSDTAYRNVVRPIFEAEELSEFRPFCTWSTGKRTLSYRDKTIQILGAKDEGARQNFQGLTMSRILCDEMTLYPDSIIQMIDTRLRKNHSKGYAAMNPTFPDHIVKQWIDKAGNGDPNYYALHFELDDNPFLSEDYKDRVKESSFGLFYKRNILGIWCLAEGAIFEFFDRDIHVLRKPPMAAEYWVAGIDYGISNAFACVLIGVNSGMTMQVGKRMWVEKEYFWDSKKQGRQKLNSELAEDVYRFLEPYALKGIYIDPSALSMKLELQRRGMHVIEANNDVLYGIQEMTSEMGKGNLFVCKDCPNLIREIENYVWDSKKSKQGDDEPVKKGDHAVDALRYVIASHKVVTYDPYKEKKANDDWKASRFEPARRF